MTPRFLRLWLTLGLLLILLAMELGVSILPLERVARPLVVVPAAAMVGTVGAVFMEVGRGPDIVRLFAAAGLLWLAILLGMGSLDPMTRTDYHVQGSTLNMR
jgi:cytochrome c oxidase subunit 4